MEIPILQTGVLYYFDRPDPKVNPEMYEPVSYENWKMLRELEPTKFTLDYDGYIQLKKEQFEREVEERKNVTFYLKSVLYSTRPEMIEQTRKSIRKIIENPFFDKWVRMEDSRMANIILTLGQ
jgi:hypothetical protein